MDFNLVALWGVRTITILFYIYTYYKYTRAKQLDNTLTLKFNLRSKIEVYGLLALNVIGLVYQPPKDSVGVYVFIASALLLVTYFSLERIVVVGRKILFARFLAFDVKQISRNEYKRGRFMFNIKGGTVKVWFPLTDTENLMQMLSGNYRRSRKQK